MLERRTPRFAVEVLILVAIAFSLAIAHLNRLAIGGAMLLGWLFVSVLEWASLRGEAHYGSGMPPRYYVPQVRLPPPRALEEPVRRSPQAPPVAAPAPVTFPVAAPVFEAPTLEPVAFVASPEPVWEPAVEEVAPPSPIEFEWTAPPALPAPVEETADPSWFVDGIPTELEGEFTPMPEFVPAPAPEFTPGPEFMPSPEVEAVVEPIAEVEPVAETPEPAISTDWLDALASTPAPFEPAPELEQEPELEAVVEPVAEVELTEPVVEIPEPVLEEEPLVEPVPELPAPTASWFDAQLPSASEPVEEPVLEVPDEPTAELAQPEPEFDVDFLAGEPLPEESVSWFETQQPAPEAELPAWALVDAEPEAERDDEFAAHESLPEELEPLLEVRPPETVLEPELDFELPVGEPLPEEPSTASWFETQPPAAAVPEQEYDWQAAGTPEIQEPLRATDPEPVAEFEFTEADLELDIMIGQLAGEPLGANESLVSWFDAPLPGGVSVPEVELSRHEAPVVRERDENGVGGWEVGQAPEAWPTRGPEAGNGAAGEHQSRPNGRLMLPGRSKLDH